MNERIKQLAEQAGALEVKSVLNIPKALSLNGAEIERFAELIVKECIMICKSHKIQSTEDVWYLAHNETVNNISENIEEYFGVEE